MAHTLSIVDGVEATTLALAATAATGYHLIAYNPIMSAYIDQRNASLYMPGDYSVMGKYQNIIETITCEIVGTSRDDLFVKLRALYRAIENARDWVQCPGIRNPVYLAYQPDSTTNTSYSCILGGRVDVPGTDSGITMGPGGEGEQLNNTMTGIVITIEREPYYRSFALSHTGDRSLSTGTIAPSLTDSIGNAAAWGAFDLDGGTYPIISGDIPALAQLEYSPRNAADAIAIDKVYVSYVSDSRAGVNPVSGVHLYTIGGLMEAELGSMSSGSFTVADATASGAGNTKVRTSFAALATNGLRWESSYGGLPPGVYRVFGRMKLTGAGSSVVYVQPQVGFYNMPALPAVTVTATAWTMYDMGLLDLSVFQPTFGSANLIGPKLFCYAAGTAGTDLEIDFLFTMPIDECFIVGRNLGIAGSVGTMRVSNMEPVSPPRGVFYTFAGKTQAIPDLMSYGLISGDIRCRPGKGRIYYMSMNASNQNVYDGGTLKYRLSLYTVALHTTARGNG